MTDAVNNNSSPAAGSSSTNNSTATAAQNSENQFLSMLTTELTNQDPLNPTDTTQFTNQLIGMSSLEQQITMNSKLDGMTTLLTQLAASAPTATPPTSTPTTGS